MPVPVSDAERQAILAYHDRTGKAEAEFNTLSTAKNQSTQGLKDIWTLMRAAGVLGKTEAMLQAAARARAKIRAISAKPETHEAHRRTIAAMMMDMARPGFAADETLRHLPSGHPSPAVQKTAARLTKTRSQLGALLTPVNRFLEGEGSLAPLENADLGLIAPLHLIAQGADGPTDLARTVLTMLATTADLAKAAGLTVSLIPDYIFASLQHRPGHILSFHTAGQFPGFVHFKKADLPGYMILDQGGYAGWSTMSQRSLNTMELPSLSDAEKICDRLYREVVLANVSNYAQAAPDADLGPLPARYVFVPLQGPLIDSPELVRFGPKAMLQMVINRFRGTDVAVVVKLHPKVGSPNLIIWLIGQADSGAIIVREDSIHTLAAGAEAVMTINSRVGSEVMIHRKPIYSFGASDYDSITHRITSAAQFDDLTTPIRPAVRDDDLLRFIAYYRTTYLVDRAEPGRLESALQERVIDPALRAKQG